MTVALVDIVAVTVGAFRGCEHDSGINYTATMESVGPNAVEAISAAGIRAGHLHPSSVDCEPHFAVLDFLDADGDIVGDMCIPTAEAFAWWVGAAELRATSSDCPTCEPAAYAAIEWARHR